MINKPLSIPVEISITVVDLLTMSSQVGADKADIAAIDVETNTSTTLVTHDAHKTNSSSCI